MKCPFCGYEDTKVTDSRAAEDGIRRRRECLRCGLRFTTYERVQTTALSVVKRDSRREDYNRGKLVTSLRLACAKRPLPSGALDKLADEVEVELQQIGKAEVPSSLIGEMVMEGLKRLDRVAYIRYASVYRDFADIDSFREEIEWLMKNRESRSPSAQLPLMPEEKPVPPEVRRLRRARRARGVRPGMTEEIVAEEGETPAEPEDAPAQQ